MIEFLQSHTNVVSQRGFDQRGYGGINPYALGFAMMTDIRRICENPTEEDRRWFPDIAGGDWLKTLDFAMRNFKDESFISQYLSPKLIRDFRFFAIADHEENPQLEVVAIHDDEGYRHVRKLLAEQHNRDNLVPDVQVVQFNRDSDRSLVLRHQQTRGGPGGRGCRPGHEAPVPAVGLQGSHGRNRCRRPDPGVQGVGALKAGREDAEEMGAKAPFLSLAQAGFPRGRWARHVIQDLPINR